MEKEDPETALMPPSFLHNPTMEAASATVAALRHMCETLGFLASEPHRPFRFMDLPAESGLLVCAELCGGRRAHIVWDYNDRKPAKSITCEDSRVNNLWGRIFITTTTTLIVACNQLYYASVGLYTTRHYLCFTPILFLSSVGHLSVPLSKLDASSRRQTPSKR